MSNPAHAALNTTAPVTVNVQNGEPSQPSVSVVENQRIIFNNLDSVDYLIQLWTKGNDKRIDVCSVLPASGTTIYQAAGDANGNGKCSYNVLTASGGIASPTAGGGNVIIIGSGNMGGH